MKTKKPNRYFHWACSLTILVSPVELNAQTVNVDVNLNVGHSFTGNATYMDRKKFINIHADVNDHDWEETDYEFTNNFRNDFLNRYDVNMGRATGGIGWTMNNVIREDPNRKGFADVSHIQSEGIRSKNNYAAKTDWHRYEGRNQQVLAAQLHPLYPDGTKTQKGWSFSQTDNSNQPFGTASGQFFAHYIKNFHGNGGGSGPLAPSYVEIVNEPLWELSDEIDKVFKFHRTVSQEIKKINPNVQVGGYCTAFPDFEVDNFDRWKNRWQKFMDSSGQFMDFWAIHLYDFPSIGRGQKRLRRGSNIEATFDMLEQYSMMKFGRIKPTIISEYGAQSHDYRGAWSPYRDYLHNTSCNAMTMQFMQRANTIGAAINFTMIKGEWATTGVNDTMGNRLVRRKNEPNSLSGPWVYADSVHFYQLWSDVKGRRVDSRPSNIDIMTDAYVTGNKAYVLLNNLDWSNKQVNINLFGRNGANIQSLKVKNYRRNNNNTAGVIYQSTHNAGSIPGSITMGAEGTAILEYTFSKNIPVNQTSNERKYYATSYLKPIRANQTLNFDINSVGTGSDQGEVMLRIGMGRAHGKSLKPTVSVNGYLVDVPTNWRGDAQADRSSFFGVLEVPVPYEFLKWNNRISLTFGDNGGHVSSVAMQVFGFSSNVRRSFLNTNAQKTFKQIAVGSDGTTWGIGSDDKIYYRSGETWKLASGSLTELSVGESRYIVGLNNARQMWQWNGTNWNGIDYSGAYKKASIGRDGTLWALKTDNSIWRRTGSSWVQMPGSLVQICVENANNIWGVNSSGQIWRWDGGNWIGVTRNGLNNTVKQVNLGSDGKAFAFLADSTLWRLDGSIWRKIPGNVSDIGVKDINNVWGVGGGGSLWFWNGAAWSQR